MKTLAPGFLIAMPQLGDPNFHRAVVLMLEHGDGGSMGLVLNHASSLTLKDVAEGQQLKLARSRERQSVYVGGPVDPQRGFVLHNQMTLEEKQEICPGVFLSVTVDALGPLLDDAECQLRFCLGYAGWGPKQLEKEIASGSWLFTEVDGVPVLGDPEKLWEAALQSMGVDPAMLLLSGPSQRGSTKGGLN